MKKGITPEKVQNGLVEYDLVSFLKDLARDVESHLADLLPDKTRKEDQKKNLKEVFYFVYEICFLSVSKKKYLDSMLENAEDEEERIVRKVLAVFQQHIEVLRAVFMRHIDEQLNRGMTRKQAVKSAVDYSKTLICDWDMENGKK